jgi:predicted nucleotidyltransferase
MGTQQIKKQLNTYIARITSKMSPEKVILFGSFARGTAHKGSDIDLLVVDSVKKKIKEHEFDLFRLQSGISSDYEFNVYRVSSEEFNAPKPWSILHDIKKEGKVIFNQ